MRIQAGTTIPYINLCTDPPETSDIVVRARLQAGDANPDGNAHRHEAGKQAPAVAAAVKGAQLPQRPEAQEAQPRRAPRRVACANPQLKALACVIAH